MHSLQETTEFVVHGSTDEPVRDFTRAHVWFCDLDGDHQLSQTGHSRLSASERARAERLKSVLKRRRFAARCAFVRHVLATLAGVAPGALKFSLGARGKPRLAFPERANSGRLAGLHFNLSHAANALALAVAFGRRVGIDVEVVKPGVDVLAIAETHFTAEECAWLRALPASERAVAFYRLWTRQEALAKVDGRGIASRSAAEPLADSQRTLHSFEFNLGETEFVGSLALQNRDRIRLQRLGGRRQRRACGR